MDDLLFFVPDQPLAQPVAGSAEYTPHTHTLRVVLSLLHVACRAPLLCRVPHY
jgi:hypothetical protein